MDSDTFDAELREAHETPLSRLGSSKSMYAITGGEMSSDGVRAAVAAEAERAATVFDGWRDGSHGALFGDLADREADRVSDEPGERAFPELDRLAAAETAPARLGGTHARFLLADTRLGQVVGFFVGDADPQSAREFRGVRDEVGTDADRVADALAEACETDADWDAAREAADAVIEAAYDDYVETLEGMGVEPKNVC